MNVEIHSDLSPLPSYSCTISNLICVPACFYRWVGVWRVNICSAAISTRYNKRCWVLRGRNLHPRLLLLPARRGYFYLWTLHTQTSSICSISAVFQTADQKWTSYALLWDITQRMAVIPYTTFREDLPVNIFKCQEVPKHRLGIINICCVV